VSARFILRLRETRTLQSCNTSYFTLWPKLPSSQAWVTGGLPKLLPCFCPGSLCDSQNRSQRGPSVRTSTHVTPMPTLHWLHFTQGQRSQSSKCWQGPGASDAQSHLGSHCLLLPLPPPPHHYSSRTCLLADLCQAHSRLQNHQHPGLPGTETFPRMQDLRC